MDRLDFASNERLCQICNEPEIEDELHFILNCKGSEDLRTRYIKKYYRKNQYA